VVNPVWLNVMGILQPIVFPLKSYPCFPAEYMDQEKAPGVYDKTIGFQLNDKVCYKHHILLCMNTSRCRSEKPTVPPNEAVWASTNFIAATVY